MSVLLLIWRRWRDRISALPEPIDYIVLDHSWSPLLPHIDGHDSKGKRYALCSPAILDEARWLGQSDHRVIGRPLPPSGIPVYRRENLPEGWPDA